MPAMTTRSGHNLKEAEDQEEGEEFYESLDRILSSSCSSTSASASASDDDSSAAVSGRRRRCRLPPPPSLDIWFAEPASVEERRRRLLRHLGLAGDPSLVRSPRGGSGALAEAARSVSCNGLRPRANPSAVIRPRSDGSVAHDSVDKSLAHQNRNGPISSNSKPPPDARVRPLSTGASEVPDDARRIDGGDICDPPLCLIKNLDDGSEFVLKEFREDGMWTALSEVGTGRHLTMEEFDMCVGRSPIVQELMRRQNAEEATDCVDPGAGPGVAGGRSTVEVRSKKRLSWLRSIKSVAGTMVAGGNSRNRRNSDAKDSSSDKGGRGTNLASDGRLDGSGDLHRGPVRIKVRRYGKSHKELNSLYMCQEIQAHNGPIWSIKFSLDGQYMASAGEDCVIHVWKVSEIDRKVALQYGKASEKVHNHREKNRKPKVSSSRRSVCSDPLMVPEYMFSLSEKPICSFQGHLDDVLDLSWSKNQYLLSSSMDKTVRLWHFSNNYCLKVFSHSDYVTCIQFNPVDDRYFISGSLDEKVRIWSIPDRQVVDWTDLHEMVTAACYTPDGQGALVGSHRGNCHWYDTSDNKLLKRTRIDLQNRKKKSRHKKITGFQFSLGNSSKVLITSADSRVRVIDGNELVHKFKGFRNTSSQISAYLTSNGKHVISASEDSNVYVWRYDDSRVQGKGGATMTRYYEHFHCEGVTVAIPWPKSNTHKMVRNCISKQCGLDGEPQLSAPPAGSTGRQIAPPLTRCCTETQQHSTIRATNLNRFSDRASATWPEELMTLEKHCPKCNIEFCSGCMAAEGRTAWGSVIVAAGRNGEIKSFQKLRFSNWNTKSAVDLLNM